MKILHIDSSVLGAASATRELTAASVDAFVTANPGAEVVYRDLAVTKLAHLDGALLQLLRPAADAVPTTDGGLAAEVALANTLIDEFLSSDIVVIGAPMYNFGIPTQLKAWIDRIAQPGRTFTYSAAGPKGLVTGMKVVIASGRGGALSGTPYEAALDHQEAYLRSVMGFFGVTDVTVVRAEGLAMGPAARETAMSSGLAGARALVDVVEKAVA